MFDKKTEIKINEAVMLELLNACKTYGANYNSYHEAYAILKEEVEEAEADIKTINDYLGSIWEEVKTDDPEALRADAMVITRYAVELAKEAVQIAAVTRKIIGAGNYAREL